MQARRAKAVAATKRGPSPLRDSVAPTAAGLVYGKLRADILRGVLLPLERLRVNDISERYERGAIPSRTHDLH